MPPVHFPQKEIGVLTETRQDAQQDYYTIGSQFRQSLSPVKSSFLRLARKTANFFRYDSILRFSESHAII